MRVVFVFTLLLFFHGESFSQQATPRQLMISVRFDDAGQASQRELGASGRISNRGADIEVRGQDSGSSSGERVAQRVRVIEGGRAMLFVGQSQPVPRQQIIQTPAGVVGQRTIVVQEASTGFEVSPRLAGNRVFLEIAPQRQRLDAQGRVESETLATTVMGRLGEWFDIGGAVDRASRDDRGIAYRSEASSGAARSIWVKVEELGN